jgi:hypothetical protein
MVGVVTELIFVAIGVLVMIVGLARWVGGLLRD